MALKAMDEHETETGFRIESDLHQLQRKRCEVCGKPASVSIFEVRTKRTTILCSACGEAHGLLHVECSKGLT